MKSLLVGGGEFALDLLEIACQLSLMGVGLEPDRWMVITWREADAHAPVGLVVMLSLAAGHVLSLEVEGLIGHLDLRVLLTSVALMTPMATPAASMEMSWDACGPLAAHACDSCAARPARICISIGPHVVCSQLVALVRRRCSVRERQRLHSSALFGNCVVQSWPWSWMRLQI